MAGTRREDRQAPQRLIREERENKKQRFVALADRLTRTEDPEQQRRLKEDLARMTFGE